MQIGILITAHTNPDHLRRLVDVLKKDFSIFIHLDKRSSIDPEIFAQESQVHVIKIHKVYWGSHNQILATLDLLKLAYEHNCDYYLLISGSDLPIKNNRDIIAEIQRSPEISYIDYNKLPRDDWPLHGGLDRLQLFWDNIDNPQSNSLSNRFLSACRYIQRFLHLKRRLLLVTYFGGPNWVNLSKEAVTYLLNFIENHPEYLKSFRYTRNADEIWLHTVLLNSPFCHQIENNPKRYIDWLSGPEYPKVLRMDDYGKILQSDGFFARKFDVNVDSSIYEKILREIG